MRAATDFSSPGSACQALLESNLLRSVPCVVHRNYPRETARALAFDEVARTHLTAFEIYSVAPGKKRYLTLFACRLHFDLDHHLLPPLPPPPAPAESSSSSSS
mmetsp:Transcript_11592/g.25056  ORF Transcript_11592/g.25056 Transcript_11592/m.25056 type:complete len:103 (-) Transcript_11592:454-762(-)